MMGLGAGPTTALLYEYLSLTTCGPALHVLPLLLLVYQTGTCTTSDYLPWRGRQVAVRLGRVVAYWGC